METERSVAGLLEEATAGMRELMAAAPGLGTGGTQAQDAQRAMARMFEGVMATNKRFAGALLDRAEPGPAVDLQRRFVGDYFDALARGGTLLFGAVREAAQQSSEQRTCKHGHENDGGEAAPAGKLEPASTGRARRPRSQAPRKNGNFARGKAVK